MDGARSNTIPVKSGVPQGSVLGPSLFLLYINDLPGRVESNARLFADDTALDRKIESPEDARILQSDLDELEKWEHEWDMCFHPDKCNVVHVSRSKKIIETDYYLHGHKLESVKSTKYLGVTLSNDGEFHEHLGNVANSGNKMLGFIRRNLKVNSKSVKEMAYKMLVRPKLEYAATVWDPYKQDQILNIEKVQRRAARIVTNRHRNTSSVTNMLEDLKWQSLEKRRKVARLTLLFKILENKVNIRNSLLKPTINRSRRTSVAHSKQLERIPCKKDLRLNAFFPRSIRQWNSLPEHVVSAACPVQFCQLLTELVE